MKGGISFLAVMLLIALIWATGCSNVAMGNVKVGEDFGISAPEQQQLLNCFIEKSGRDPRIAQKPDVIAKLVTTNIVNETPVDNVTRFNKDTFRIHYWAFYEGFKKGDNVTMNMHFRPISNTNGLWTRINVSAKKITDGQYGAIYGSVEKPDIGWPLGDYSIILCFYHPGDPTPVGGCHYIHYEIINGPTEKGSLPCQKVNVSLAKLVGNASISQGNEQTDSTKLTDSSQKSRIIEPKVVKRTTNLT